MSGNSGLVLSLLLANRPREGVAACVIPDVIVAERSDRATDSGDVVYDGRIRERELESAVVVGGDALILSEH